jgi:hypothetical protein
MKISMQNIPYSKESGGGSNLELSSFATHLHSKQPGSKASTFVRIIELKNHFLVISNKKNA